MLILKDILSDYFYNQYLQIRKYGNNLIGKSKLIKIVVMMHPSACKRKK